MHLCCPVHDTFNDSHVHLLPLFLGCLSMAQVCCAHPAWCLQIPPLGAVEPWPACL